jgi:hypothetical protein
MNFYRAIYMAFVRQIKSMKILPRILLAVLAGGSLTFLGQQAQAQGGPITGNITWAGSVELNTSSAATATGVIANGWHGTATGGLPAVQSVDGDLDTFINPGDATTFASPWSFNSGPVPSFWTVGGFTFDLTASAIPPGGQGGTPGTSGFVLVLGTGTVSGHGFTPTAGTFRFSTQDSGAGTPQEFSFSASTSVPEGSTVALLGIGGACLITRMLTRKKFKAD